jgi:hypothetical protein
MLSVRTPIGCSYKGEEVGLVVHSTKFYVSSLGFVGDQKYRQETDHKSRLAAAGEGRH